MSVLISKEQFVNSMNGIKHSLMFEDEMSNIVQKYNGDYDFWPPNCVDVAIDLLEKIFDDKDEYISYFIFDLEFGDQWYPEAVKDENGETVFMENVEELYDYLVRQLEEG